MSADDGWATLRTCCPVCKQGNYYWRHPGGSKANAEENCPEKGYIVQLNATSNQIRCDGCKAASTYEQWQWQCSKHGMASMGDWHIHPIKCGACARAFGNGVAPFYTFKGLKKDCTVCNKTAPQKHDGGQCDGVLHLVRQMRMQMMKKRNQNNNDNDDNKTDKNNDDNKTNPDTQNNDDNKTDKNNDDNKTNPDTQNNDDNKTDKNNDDNKTN
eukprot:255141_1